MCSRCSKFLIGTVFALSLVLAQADPLFAAAAKLLKEKCTIPARLPKALPDVGQGSERIYAVPQTVGRDSYLIILGYTQDCNGASFCRLGSLQARAAPQGRSPLHGKPVRLARGIRGFFTEATCGAGCSDSKVEWQQEDAIYSAGLKGAKLQEVVPLANAVIASPPN
jgi:hypothetical protein